MFRDVAWEAIASAELEQRRRENDVIRSQADPTTARRLADLSFQYPTIPGGVATGMAMAGLEPGSPEADQMSEWIAQYEARVKPKDAGDPTIFDRGYSVLKGAVRGLFTFGTSVYDEISKGIPSWFTGLAQGMSPGEAARGSFGFSAGALAVASARQGRPVNLGSGFLPGGDFAQETVDLLRQGVPLEQAVRNPAQLEIGLPAFDYGEAIRESKGVQIRSDDGLTSVPVTIGRLAANTITEPGTRPFHYMSGLVDLGANIWLDPSAGLGKGVGVARASNKALIADSILAKGVRPSALARGTEEWLSSGHGQAVADWIAKNRNFADIWDIVSDAASHRPEASWVSALTKADNADDVRDLIRAGVESQHINQILGKQSLAQRGIEGLAEAFGANPRQVTSARGWRAIIGDRLPGQTWLDRMTAQVGGRAISVVDNVDQATLDIGEWMKVAGFQRDRIGYWMEQMADVLPGETDRAYEVVTGMVSEWGKTLEDAGLAGPVVDQVTKLFSDVEDLKKYWINQAGDAVLFPGSRFKINVGGQLVALPTAHLTSEFLSRSVPIIDAKVVRDALRKRKWAERISTVSERAGQSYLSRLDDFDKFGPGTLTSMMDMYMNKAWKPMTLLRLAWPVRVIGEEQIRMAAAGLDSGINHPIRAIALAIGKGKADEFTDIAGNFMEEQKIFRDAMSRGGDTLLHRQSAAYDVSEWVRVEKGSKRWREGWAIQLNHLADDPLAQALARELTDTPDDAMGAIARVKQRFWDGDLADQRVRMGRDGRSWKMFEAKNYADGYVDSVLARLQQAAGGRWRAHDWVRGEWFDDLGNAIPADMAPPPLRRQRPMLGYANETSSPVFQRMFGQMGKMQDGTYTALLDQIDAGDVDAAETLTDLIRQLDVDFNQITGGELGNVIDLQGADDLMELVESSIEGMLNANSYDRSVLEQLLGSTLNELKSVKSDSTKLLTPGSGRAEMSAADLMDITSREGREMRYGGLTDQGTAGGREALDEILDRPYVERGELGPAFQGEATQLEQMTRARVDPGMPENGTFVLPERPARGGEKAGHTYREIYVAHDGYATGMLVGEYDATGRLVDIPGMRIVRDQDGNAAFRTDAAALMKAAMDELEDGTELYDLAFGGVPIRDWLASAGIDPATLSLGEMLEEVQTQFGKSWAARGTGGVADLPSVALTEDGQKVVDSVLRKSREMARRNNIPGSQMDPYNWSQDRMMYEITEWGNPEIVRAIAEGTIGDAAIATSKMGLAPGAKPKNISDIANKLMGMDDFGPQWTAVAREMDRGALDGVNRAVDALFHALGSAPTNRLSRSPAFKQFYSRRLAELYPLMDETAQQQARLWAQENGIPSLKDALRATFSGDTATEVAFNRRAKDFVKGRFDGISGSITLEEADEVAKMFALTETKALLYDQSKKSNFFDITRNIFPFGEAWAEILTTWGRLVNENPQILARGSQLMQGARQAGVFYPDPSTGQELFSFPGSEMVSDWMLGTTSEGPLEANANFVGSVSGLNIAASVVPGVGPMVQLAASQAFGEVLDDPNLRILRDLVFPFGTPGRDEGPVDALIPSWMAKALVALERPTGDDERLFANTMTDVLRAMQVNGEVDLSTPEGFAEAEKLARERAKRIYQIRALSQFVGPVGAQVQWDVESDRNGVAWTYQALTTAYFEELEEAGGDQAAAMDEFIKLFGLDPFDPMDRALGRESLAGIIRGKSRQIVPRTVTEEGLDYEAENPELFADFPLTAYFTRPDDPNEEFNYNAYLNQLEERTRVGLTPEEWRRERNILLGNMAYNKAREGVIRAGTENNPAIQAWLRTLRFQLEEKYDGYGYGSLGTQAISGDEVRREFESWRTDPRMLATDAGQGLAIYLDARQRAVELAASQFGITEDGFATSKQAEYLRNHLFGLAQSIAMQHPDFAAIFERYYAREVDNPLAQAPTSFLGVDLTSEDQT